MWSNHSEWDATWETKDYLQEVYPSFYEKWYVVQISGRDFYKGEGCKTLGVRLALLHLHCMNISIIHSYMSIYI
jgi:hypothetical protein